MIYTIVTAKHNDLHFTSDLGNSEIFFLDITADIKTDRHAAREEINAFLKKERLYHDDIVAIYEGKLEDLYLSIF